MISVKNKQYSLSKTNVLISLFLIFATLISVHVVNAQSTDQWVQLGTAIVEQPTYYTVSYEKETDNGIVVKDAEDMPNQYVAEGASVGELSAAPYDDKYYFDGYYSGDETFDENSTINSDTVVTAKYTANTERNISADTEIGNVSYYAQGSTAFPAEAVPTASYIETNLFDNELLSFNLGISTEDWVPEEDVNITVLLSIPIDISSYNEVFLYDEYGNSISCGTTVLSDNLYALLFTVNSLGDFHVTGNTQASLLKSTKLLSGFSLKSAGASGLLGATSSCLTFSSDGKTVTGTDGTCTVVTAADFKNATEIKDGTSSTTGVFYSSRNTLTSVTFSSNLTKIGKYAFYNCTNLTGSLTIPNSVTSIGNNAFYNCSGLTGSLTIPNSVTSIGGSAFYGCSGLTGSLTIGNSVTTIGSSAFYNCKNLTGSLTIPSSVTTIGTAVFQNCSGFTGRLTIPSSITTISSSAFEGCSGLTGSLTIPSSVTFIAAGAFRNCKNLTGSLTIPNSVTGIGSSAFEGCSGLTGSLTIPNSVTGIGVYAFENCSGFNGSLTIGNSVTSIGSAAFFGCSGLTGSLTIGNSVTKIADYAFKNCSGLTGRLTIPNSVTQIGRSAFENCSGLDGILFTNKTATVGTSAFAGAAPVYLYADSTWINDGGGTKVPFITSLSAADVTVDKGDSVQASFTSDQTQSNAYIPSVTWVASTPSALTMTSPTGKGITANTITGNTAGTYTVTLTAAQPGSEIFGTSAVPAIPSTTFNITVNKGTCLTFSADGTTVTGTDGTCTVVTAANFKNATMIADGTSYTTGVFYNSRNTLTSVTFPSTFEIIGNYAFSNCNHLTGSLSIPNSVTSIGNGAFAYCSGLTGSLTIPDSVITIGTDAFYFCSGLTGTLTISNSATSIGDGAFYGCSGLTGDLIIPNSVISIGNGAFRGCTSLNGNLTIGNSVTTFGNNVFYNCSGLKGNVIIPSSVSSLGNNVFYNCSGLNGILFTNKTATVGAGAFYNTAPVYCYADSSWINNGNGTKIPFVTSLTAADVTVDKGDSIQVSFTTDQATSEAYIPSVVWVASTPSAISFAASPTGKGITTNTITGNTKGTYTVTLSAAQVGSDIFNAAVVPAIPDAIFNVTVNSTCLTFSADGTTVTGTDGTCTVVTAADFKNATVIADGTTYTTGVFYNSRNSLTSVTFPSNLTKIGKYAFYNCKNLSGNLIIPDTVTIIEDSAFEECDKLTGDLTIPNSVTSIGRGAFYNCSGFTGNLTISDSVTFIGEAAFRGCSGFKGNLTIGDSVASIGISAFYNCSGFTGNLTIPDSVTSLGSTAFYGCSGFTGNLTIPDTITSIGNGTFRECRNLTGSVIVPASITSIGNNAFYNCSGLDGILFTNKTATIGTGTFYSAAPVYCYADSSWINDGGGTKVPFISSLAAADVTVYEGDSVQTSFTSDQPTSNAYIPSTTWTSSDTSVATINNAATGKGVLSNTAKGKKDGTSTVTISAAQVGSDIFGAAAVPAIPSTTFNVNVEWREVSPTGVDLNWESVITTSTFFLITALALIFLPKVIKREKQD